MNKYHERLKLFMKLKGDKVKQITGIEFYCSDKAIESIKKSRKTYLFLKDQIILHEECALTGPSCPFCLYIHRNDMECFECGWAKENGDCANHESVFYKIIESKECEKLDRALSNKFYRSIIKECEKIITGDDNE